MFLRAKLTLYKYKVLTSRMEVRECINELIKKQKLLSQNLDWVFYSLFMVLITSSFPFIWGQILANILRQSFAQQHEVLSTALFLWVVFGFFLIKRV